MNIQLLRTRQPVELTNEEAILYTTNEWIDLILIDPYVGWVKFVKEEYGLIHLALRQSATDNNFQEAFNYSYIALNSLIRDKGNLNGDVKKFKSNFRNYMTRSLRKFNRFNTDINSTSSYNRHNSYRDRWLSIEEDRCLKGVDPYESIFIEEKEEELDNRSKGLIQWIKDILDNDDDYELLLNTMVYKEGEFTSYSKSKGLSTKKMFIIRRNLIRKLEYTFGFDINLDGISMRNKCYDNGWKIPPKLRKERTIFERPIQEVI